MAVRGVKTIVAATWLAAAGLVLVVAEEVFAFAPVRVPGCDTAIRLAVRIEVGHSIEVAAAREYLYRWRLALQSPIFGAPHALGT